VLAAEGHIEGIEGFGTVVVFSAQRCLMMPGRPLQGRVRRVGGRTLLEMTSDAPSPRRWPSGPARACRCTT
jgi:hypothetical protein